MTKDNICSLKYAEFANCELEELVACMEDSDRYINEFRKSRLIDEIKHELVARGEKQYVTN